MDPLSYGRASGSASRPPEENYHQAGSAAILLDNWHFLASPNAHGVPPPTGADYGHDATLNTTGPNPASSMTSTTLLAGTGFHSQRPGQAQPTVSFVARPSAYDRVPRVVPFAQAYEGDPRLDYHANTSNQPHPSFPVVPSNSAPPHLRPNEYAMSTETSLDNAMDFYPSATQGQMETYSNQDHDVGSTSGALASLPPDIMVQPSNSITQAMGISDHIFDDGESDQSESDHGEPPAQRRRLNDSAPEHLTMLVAVASTSSHQYPQRLSETDDNPQPPPRPVVLYYDASTFPIPQRLIVCIAQTAVPCLGIGVLLGVGVTPLDSEVASEISAVMPTRRTRSEIMAFSGIIKVLCNEVRFLPENEKGPVVQDILNNMYSHRIGKEVSAIIYRKVESFLKIMTEFVVDLICNKDIFGLRKWDNVYCLPTFLAEIGRMATSMSHTHWFLLHGQSKGLRVTDVEIHSMTSTRPGSAVIPGVISAPSPIAYRIACKFSAVRAKKVTMEAAVRARKTTVKASRPSKKAGAQTAKKPAKASQNASDNSTNGPSNSESTASQNAEGTPDVAAHPDRAPDPPTSSIPPPTQAQESSSSNSDNAEPQPPLASATDSSNAAPSNGTPTDPENARGEPIGSDAAGSRGGDEEKGTGDGDEGGMGAREGDGGRKDAGEGGGGAKDGGPGKGDGGAKDAGERDSEGSGGGKDDPRKERSGARKHVGDRVLRTDFGGLKALILNFNGEALTETTEYQFHVLNQLFMDVDSGQSVVKAFYDHQADVEAIGGAEDHTWRTAITPQAIICSVIQYIYDQQTLQINPAQIPIHKLAQEVMRSKLVTAAENMGQWVTDEPEEHLILRNRLLGMMGTICDSSELDHQSLVADLKQTFRPSISDHLQVPGQSFTERYRPHAVRSNSGDRDVKFTRDLLVRLLPPRD